MRADLDAILEWGHALLDEIGRRDDANAGLMADRLIGVLPPEDVFDPSPGVTVCFGMEEYHFRQVLPYLRGSARRWRAWLNEPDGEWPDPDRLRECLRLVGEINARMELNATG